MRRAIRQQLARKGVLAAANAYTETSVADAFSGRTYTVREVAAILKRSPKFVQRKYHDDPRVFHIPGSGSRVSLLIPHHVLEDDLRAMLPVAA